MDSILDYLEEEGCPHCGEQPGEVLVNGPSEIILDSCDHTINAEPYLATQ